MTALPPLLQRLVAAAPDAVTAGFFLVVWLDPLRLGEGSVRTAMLIMLVEFVLIHATGFLGAFALATLAPRRVRVLGILGFGLFYALFIGAFMAAFQAWWPALVFGWLLVGKFARVLTGGGDGGQIASLWAASVLLYLGGAFLTVLAPLPRLGVTAAVLPQLDLVGEGLWMDQPHRALAFGVLYFGGLAWFKWANRPLPCTATAGAQPRPTASGKGS
jgi:hypothetical protein